MDNQTDGQSPLIEAPKGLLPDLTTWGIENPVALGVCLDTYENRTIIRDHKSRYVPVMTADGEPTNLIQVVTKEMKKARTLNRKDSLLTDPRSTNSDYLTGTMLLLEHDVDSLIPAWVLSATRQWQKIESERTRRGEDAPVYRPSIQGPPGRCRADTLTGDRCLSWHNGSVQYDGLCRIHLSSANRYGTSEHADPGIQTRARNRLMSASMAAVDKLEELMYKSESDAVKLKASTEILDRSGIRGGFEIDQKVEVQVRPPQEVLRERLARLEEAARRQAAIEAGTLIITEDENGEAVETIVVEEVKSEEKE